MKLGLSMWSVVHAVKAGTLDTQLFIQFARDNGADGVELLDFFATATDESIPDWLKASGLPCGVFSVSNNFAKPSSGDRENALQRVFSGIDEAVRLGASVVRVFGGDDHERKLSLDDAFDWIVDGLATASQYAAKAGVKLGLENHGSMAGRSDQVRRIITEVRKRSGTDVLGANVDTGNFVLVMQDSVEAIHDLADLIAMVHFKDFKPAPADWEGFAYAALDGTKFVGTALGIGAVDLAGAVQVLKDSGFNGWINLEYEGDESPMTAIPRSMEFARKLLA